MRRIPYSRAFSIKPKPISDDVIEKISNSQLSAFHKEYKNYYENENETFAKTFSITFFGTSAFILYMGLLFMGPDMYNNWKKEKKYQNDIKIENMKLESKLKKVQIEKEIETMMKSKT